MALDESPPRPVTSAKPNISLRSHRGSKGGIPIACPATLSENEYHLDQISRSRALPRRCRPLSATGRCQRRPPIARCLPRAGNGVREARGCAGGQEPTAPASPRSARRLTSRLGTPYPEGGGPFSGCDARSL